MTKSRSEDQEILLEALRAHGGLDKDFRYRAGEDSAGLRGYAKDPGGGLGAAPVAGRADRAQGHPDVATLAEPAELPRL